MLATIAATLTLCLYKGDMERVGEQALRHQAIDFSHCDKGEKVVYYVERTVGEITTPSTRLFIDKVHIIAASDPLIVVGFDCYIISTDAYGIKT